MHPFSSPFGVCTQCTFNYGPKCRFLWLQIRIFPTPKMRLFPASALMALGCWHRWLCDYSELSKWEPPTKAPGPCQGPRSASNALPVPQNTTSGQESKPNRNQNSVFPQLHTVRCQLRLRTNEFFVQRITRPVALLTWPAGMEKRGNGWCSIPGQDWEQSRRLNIPGIRRFGRRIVWFV